MQSERSDNSPLRVGVVGLGFAGEQHLKNYLRQPNVEAVALAGMEKDKLAELGRRYGVPNLYDSWEELVARDDLDAVSIGTPNHLHAPIAVAALEGGKHVLCEKPLARTGEEAGEIVRAAREAGRVVHIAFTQRERGDVQALKRHVVEGSLGEIYHAKATWMRRNGIPGMGSWFTSKEMAGGGPLIDLGVHMIDMALFLMGDPEVESVSCATYAELGPRGRGGRGDSKTIVGDAYEVEDMATAFIRLAGGATLNLEAGWAAYRESSDDFGVTLYGTDGGAEMKVKNYGTEDTVRIYTDVAGYPAVVAPEIQPREGHYNVVRRFVETIRGGGDWKGQAGEDGLRRARVIDACYASSLEGREILLDGSGEPK